MAPGDRLMVQSGELVPTDGLLLTSAVLDELRADGRSAAHPPPVRGTCT